SDAAQRDVGIGGAAERGVVERAEAESDPVRVAVDAGPALAADDAVADTRLLHVDAVERQRNRSSAELLGQRRDQYASDGAVDGVVAADRSRGGRRRWRWRRPVRDGGGQRGTGSEQQDGQREQEEAAHGVHGRRRGALAAASPTPTQAVTRDGRPGRAAVQPASTTSTPSAGV